MDKIKWYKEVLELDPNTTLFLNLALLQEENGALDEAVATMREGLKRHPNHLEARIYYAELLYKANLGQEFLAEMRKLHTMFSRYIDFWRGWASFLSNQDKSADAASILRFMAAYFRHGQLSLNEVINRGLDALVEDPIPPKSKDAKTLDVGWPDPITSLEETAANLPLSSTPKTEPEIANASKSSLETELQDAQINRADLEPSQDLNLTPEACDLKIEDDLSLADPHLNPTSEVEELNLAAKPSEAQTLNDLALDPLPKEELAPFNPTSDTNDLESSLNDPSLAAPNETEVPDQAQPLEPEETAQDLAELETFLKREEAQTLSEEETSKDLNQELDDLAQILEANESQAKTDPQDLKDLNLEDSTHPFEAATEELSLETPASKVADFNDLDLPNENEPQEEPSNLGAKLPSSLPDSAFTEESEESKESLSFDPPSDHASTFKEPQDQDLESLEELQAAQSQGDSSNPLKESSQDKDAFMADQLSKLEEELKAPKPHPLVEGAMAQNALLDDLEHSLSEDLEGLRKFKPEAKTEPDNTKLEREVLLKDIEDTLLEDEEPELPDIEADLQAISQKNKLDQSFEEVFKADPQSAMDSQEEESEELDPTDLEPLGAAKNLKDLPNQSEAELDAARERLQHAFEALNLPNEASETPQASTLKPANLTSQENLNQENFLKDPNLAPELLEQVSTRTRSMAEILAEQGDIKGALDIYEELKNKAQSEGEAKDIKKRIDSLKNKLSNAPKMEIKHVESEPTEDRSRVLNLLETLSKNLEARAQI